MTPENLTFSTEQFYKTYNPSNFFLGFLRDNNGILQAHSEFNYSHHDATNTLYINQLSTFHAHVRGYVEEILGKEASSQYYDNPKNTQAIRHCTPKMIAEIINFAPEAIDYIVIPCAEKRQEILKKHYLAIWEQFLADNIVEKIGYHHHDSVYFKIAK